MKDLYRQGASGFLAAADITRCKTLDALIEWIDRMDRVSSYARIVLTVRKSDWTAEAQFGSAEIARWARALEGEFLMTSMKRDRIPQP